VITAITISHEEEGRRGAAAKLSLDHGRGARVVDEENVSVRRRRNSNAVGPIWVLAASKSPQSTGMATPPPQVRRRIASTRNLSRNALSPREVTAICREKEGRRSAPVSSL
jgi:hypothetical protein